jgi:hypothetical protein
MVEFMIIAAPRSATTWASNWLTTDETLCLHDPLIKWTRDELDAIETPKMLGIACTAIALFPEWVNAHPARKVILHRDLSEVDDSLDRIGMTGCGSQWAGVLDRIDGVHMPWDALFDPVRAKAIYEYLLDRPFDAERWAVLREINAQPHFQGVSINREATARFMSELRPH